MKYILFEERPPDFNPTLEGAACFCSSREKLLFVKRHPNKAQGNKWSIPGGKIEPNETPREAIVREIREETGLEIDGTDLRMLGKIYCRLPHMDYIFYLFVKVFQTFPEIALHLDEHLEYKWVTFDKALTLPLIAGGIETLHYYREKSRDF